MDPEDDEENSLFDEQNPTFRSPMGRQTP